MNLCMPSSEALHRSLHINGHAILVMYICLPLTFPPTMSLTLVLVASWPTRLTLRTHIQWPSHNRWQMQSMSSVGTCVVLIRTYTTPLSCAPSMPWSKCSPVASQPITSSSSTSCMTSMGSSDQTMTKHPVSHLHCHHPKWHQWGGYSARPSTTASQPATWTRPCTTRRAWCLHLSCDPSSAGGTYPSWSLHTSSLPRRVPHTQPQIPAIGKLLASPLQSHCHIHCQCRIHMGCFQR